MKTVLVTGATGFVGSCLVRRLVALGHDVHILRRGTSDPWRIRDLRDSLTEHQSDLRDPSSVENTVSEISPDVVCHLATYGGFSVQQDRSETLAVNFLGTVNLVRACERTETRLFINTGSSSEYGIKDGPMKETDLLEPLGEYGVAKAASTLYCRSAAQERGLPIVTLRLFSPYGPWDAPSRFVPSVITNLLRRRAPKLSMRQSVRDYVFIDDVVDCYVGLIEHPTGVGEIFNIGSGKQYTIGEVAAVLGRLIAPDIAPVWGGVDRQRPEPACWVADRTKAEKNLRWSPRVPIEKGLAKTVEWFKGHLELYPPPGDA